MLAPSSSPAMQTTTPQPHETARRSKRTWSDMNDGEHLFRTPSSSSGDGGGGGGGGAEQLQWGATGARQRRKRTPGRAPRAAALALDDDESADVAIVGVVEPPAPAPAAPLPRARPQPTPRRAAGPPHPGGGEQAPRAGPRRAGGGGGPAALGQRDQEQEDARLARQLMQEEEARRQRAEDFARSRMQMWQDLEESSATRGRLRQQIEQQMDMQQQQLMLQRFGQPPAGQQQPLAAPPPPGRRHRSGGRRGHLSHPQFAPPPFMGGGPGLPPSHVLFGSFGGALGGPGGRAGGPPGVGSGGFGVGGLPASLAALREAVQGLQRSGLPPHLLFSDRDFTADDYDMLCRLDETVENKRGASAAQLSGLPTQTVAAGGLLGEGGERLACSVCLEEYGEGQQMATLPCCHRFHAGCIRTWLQQKATCPVCQQKV
jgi:hypothetical protein